MVIIDELFKTDEIMTINYTIIIPHKNVPNLLKRLLETIPSRSDMEIIIIDDNSDSEIVDFSKFPGNDRVNTTCLFLKETKGAGYARNLGIKHAKGKWILFADADDLYTKEISKLLELYAEDDSTDLVIINASRLYEDGNIIKPMEFDRYINNYKNNRILSEKILKYAIWTPWSRMVKRSLVERNNLRYEEIQKGNDMMFCLLCSYYAKVINIFDKSCYLYYVPKSGSITASYYRNQSTIEEHILLLSRVNKLYSEANYPFRNSYILNYLVNRQYYKDNVTYKNTYWKVVKELDVNLCKDVAYMFLHYIGKIARII